jgi:hypothetical protein
MQTLYLMAAEMEIGACAIASATSTSSAKMTGLAFHVEGRRQIAIGRGAKAIQRPSPIDGASPARLTDRRWDRQ